MAQPYNASLVLKPTPHPGPRHHLVHTRLCQPSLVPHRPPAPVANLPSPNRLGRRKVLILNYLQTAVSGTCAAFSPNFAVYCAFRFLSGMALAGIALNCMTLSEGCSAVLPSCCLLSQPTPPQP